MLSGLCGEIFDCLGTKVIAISSSIDSETSSTFLHQLEELTSLFDKYGVRYWLDSGTLLGVVRDGTILASDPDIDIGVRAKDADNLVFVLRELNDLGFRINTIRYRRNVVSYWIVPNASLSGNVRPIDIKLFRQCGKYAWCASVEFLDRFDGNSHTLMLWRRLRGLVWRIWTYLIPELSVRVWPLKYFFDVSCWWVPAQYFDEIVRLPNGFVVPADTAQYLAYRYGNWKIPVSHWDYIKDNMAYKKELPEELCAAFRE